MTTIDTSAPSRFAGAAKVYELHTEIARAGGLNASKSNLSELTADTDVARELLAFLIGSGLLSQRQAEALWELITGGGGFTDLPEIPFDEGRPGPSVYDLVRASLAARAAQAEGSVDSIDSVQTVVEVIVAVAEAIQTAGGAVSDAISFLAGLFS
ncbi:hypothetical protein [Kineosporia succinea]|uniref:Uncharacterized protein n=1 Tax=Kineosporia succinea TaxID=84632 RepID=A0ABT9P583_9ACTN|nr:hypothetical protein [Kineosporia succinea]MDP9827861.1 hypothetical protein [Kineosporia succinea]